MKFKKGKYNIIFLLMFILIMGVFGFEIFNNATPTEVVVPVTPGAEDDEPGQEGDLPQPDDPTQSGKEEVKDEVDKKMPTSQYPLKVLNYVINKLYDGKGYKSTYIKTMSNTANIMGGITVNQSITGTIDKCGDKSLEKLEFRASGSMPDMAVNLIRAFYIDGDTVTHYQTASYNYDFSTATKTEMNMSEFYSKYALNLADKPVFTFSTANFTGALKTQKTSSGKQYYTITATMINPNILLTSGYARYYETSGDLKDVKPVSAVFTIQCYKNSGEIFSISSKETYTGTNPAFGVPVDVNINITQTFSSVGQEFEITKP